MSRQRQQLIVRARGRRMLVRVGWGYYRWDCFIMKFMLRWTHMARVTIPKEEYQRLRRYSAAYLKIAEELALAERVYPYDYPYIRALTRQALAEYQSGRAIIADSVAAALAKFKRRRK